MTHGNTEDVAAKICEITGHKIELFTFNETYERVPAFFLCTACGMKLNEIRGEVKNVSANAASATARS